MHKPNKHTVLPVFCVPGFFSCLALTKVRGLGGKLGETVVQALVCQSMSELVERAAEEDRAEYK